MRTILACAMICVATITLSAKDAEYIVLDNQKELVVNNKDKDADTHKRMREKQLSEYKPIKTAGYRSARVFYQIIPKETHGNDGNLTGNDYVEITWFHEFPAGSYEVDSKKMYSRSTTSLSTTAEFPIYGNESRMVVAGVLPDDTYETTCTIYLVK